MARGRKHKLEGNIVRLSTVKNPSALHIRQAAELKPDWLNEEESATWDKLAPRVAMIGRLQPEFAEMFAEWCTVRMRVIKWRKALDLEDWTYTSETRNGVQHKSLPGAAQYNDDWRKLRILASEFGLAPASNKGLLAELEEDDEFDKL